MESLVLISISIATILYVLGFIMLFRYKRDKIRILEEELEALNNLLDGCDKMVNELNNVSDYVVSNIEEKSNELKKLIKKADNKIKDINIDLESVQNVPIKSIDSEIVEKIQEESSEPKKRTKRSKKTEGKDSEQSKSKDFSKTISESVSSVINAYENNINLVKKLEKAEDKKPKYLIEPISIDEPIEINFSDKPKKFSLLLNSKTKEVIELSKQGLDTTEIAKKLGIGKGEIELILGLKK